MLAEAVPAALLAGRYRLDRRCGGRDGIELWQATDEVLARRVAVRVHRDCSPDQAAATLAAAGRAGLVPDARWVRVLDVGNDVAATAAPAAATGRRARTAGRDVWVVSEWADGRSLSDVLRDGPMATDVAVRVARGCAEAVAAAHEAGVGHGCLDTDAVLLAADSTTPRLLGLSAAAGGPSDDRVDDVAALGRLLDRCLAGRRLPVVLDRSRRAAAAVARQAGTADLPDAAAVARRLRAVEAGLPGQDEDRPLRLQRRRAAQRRWAWRIVPPLLVVAVGVGTFTLGTDLGRVPTATRTAPGGTGFPAVQHSGGARAAGSLVWTRPPQVTSFDPAGDGAEDAGATGLSVDDDPSTLWQTDTYRGSAEFGGLKPGVGLLVRLRRPEQVSSAALLLSAPGADLQLRSAGRRPQQLADTTVVAQSSDAPSDLRLRLRRPVDARWWLLWVTSLPRAGTGYRLGVAELALLH